MIQAVSYFILLSISFFKRKSYILYFVCIVFLWLIASFTTGNADEQIYQSRYDEYQLWEDNTVYGAYQNMQCFGINVSGI